VCIYAYVRANIYPNSYDRFIRALEEHSVIIPRADSPYSLFPMTNPPR